MHADMTDRRAGRRRAGAKRMLIPVGILLVAFACAMLLTQGPTTIVNGVETFQSSSLPSGAVQAMAWGTGSADRYVVTDTSIFRLQPGGPWENLEAPTGGNAIVALGGTQVLVVGPPGISLLRVR